MRWKRRCALTGVWKTDELKHLQDPSNSDRDIHQLSLKHRRSRLAVRAIRVEIEDSGSDSALSRSNGEEKPRNVFVAATSDLLKDLGDQGAGPAEKRLDGSATRITLNKACTHCGSKRHDDRGCWKRFTCQNCGRRGHSSDKCLHVFAACGEIHDGGNAPWRYSTI